MQSSMSITSDSLTQQYQPGDQVCLKRGQIRSSRPCEKLSEKYLGPFFIQEAINPVAYKLKLPSSTRLHPVFHVSLLQPYHGSTIPGRTQPNPSPLMLDEEGQPIFEVEFIADCRRVRSQLQYLVHWKGYSMEERTWEPVRLLTSRLQRYRIPS